MFGLTKLAAKGPGLNFPYVDIFLLVLGSILLYLYSKITSKRRIRPISIVDRSKL
jgi:hypothetical protein